ncbi:heat shock protein HspQ [Sedimenticola selenatireducens]|jgi:heat shock protein HspQ|uniref:Heat shock protein HspQ n=1 Tax=Sedimenticola selenatireducens TaxID=191960 RepID=A0A558DL28_9GAMM|nr:heat shock protein HspQ [Sedimenticola selenatireducens]TVO70032.1 heat shock protein HspQ [Sedimenticola selenatireducens]TVT61726.1 MAG: heat shock protein HspQ [Sedimenticola selenatireducens]
MKQVSLNIGQLVQHKLFGYRGVIYDVDAEFQLSEAWYEQMAKSRPPKDEPWYRVLVDGSDYETYVAQCNLEPDESDQPIENPYIDALFTHFTGNRYIAGDIN